MTGFRGEFNSSCVAGQLPTHLIIVTCQHPEHGSAALVDKGEQSKAALDLIIALYRRHGCAPRVEDSVGEL